MEPRASNGCPFKRATSHWWIAATTIAAQSVRWWMREADVILRFNSGAFPLLDAEGRPFEPIDWLRPLAVGDLAQREVQFQCGKRGKLLKARLCAIRKTAEQARDAQIKARRKAQKNGVQIRAQTLDYAEFIIVLTTLAESEMPLRTVLEFYRSRWQVELAFKRLKTLLQIGHVPKTKAESSQAWMQGKILTALLIERMLCEARFFSVGISPPMKPASGCSSKSVAMHCSCSWRCP